MLFDQSFTAVMQEVGQCGVAIWWEGNLIIFGPHHNSYQCNEDVKWHIQLEHDEGICILDLQLKQYTQNQFWFIYNRLKDEGNTLTVHSWHNTLWTETNDVISILYVQNLYLWIKKGIPSSLVCKKWIFRFQLSLLLYSEIVSCMLQSCNVLLLLLYFGCTTSHRSYSFWMSPSTAGALGSLSLFCGVSLVLTRDAEGPRYCEPGVFIAEERENTGNKGSGCYRCWDIRTWDYFPQLPKYQDFWSNSIWIKVLPLQ